MQWRGDAYAAATAGRAVANAEAAANIILLMVPSRIRFLVGIRGSEIDVKGNEWARYILYSSFLARLNE